MEAKAGSVEVLQVVESCGAGVGRHVRSLCQGLAGQGHRVTVAYGPHRADKAFQRFVEDWKEEIQFVALQLRREVSPTSDLRVVFQLLRLIKAHGGFDIVHGHSSKGGAIARLAGHVSRIPTVYTPHGLVVSYPEFSGLETTIYGAIERALGHYATSKLVAVSEGERKTVQKLGLAPADRIALVENGLEDQEFDFFQEREKGLDSVATKPLTFGSVMRFSREKSPENLVEAFIQLNEALPQFPMRLVIAGDGPLFAQTKERVESCGLAERISLLGWITDVREVLCDMDVYVLSSFSEGGPYSVMEAMAAKLPVVATNVSGINETIARVAGNIVVPVGDPGALAQGMKRMAVRTSPETLRRAFQEVGQNNYEHARANFRQEPSTQRTLQVYRSLCGKEQSASLRHAGHGSKPPYAETRKLSGQRTGT